MKNWLKGKPRDWLFADEPRTRITEHRLINVPAEVITLRSQHDRT